MKILDECFNHYGPLSSANRQLLEKLLDRPNNDLWYLAKRIVISPLPLITVEMAVFRISLRAPEACPDPFTLYRAIRHATACRYQFQKQPIALDIET